MIALIEGFCNMHIEGKHSGTIPENEAASSGRTSASEVVITSLGAKGDGVAERDGQRVHVPFTLPGELVRIAPSAGRGGPCTIVEPSPSRVAPVCAHFGVCGGCAVQHARETVYAAWKEGLVRWALAREGIDAAVGTLRTYPIASRRRTAFRAARTSLGTVLGYSSARTHDLVDVFECPILVPQLQAAIAPLKSVMTVALPANSEARVHLTITPDGMDCAIEGPELSPRVRSNAAALLLASKLGRVSWNGEPIVVSHPLSIAIAETRVPYPPGAFLQAVEACETDMAAFAMDSLADSIGPKKPVCDLFSGLGAFAFHLARIAPVTAYEMDEGAVNAMTAAVKTAKGMKPLKAIRRDLYRNPLGTEELNRFAAAVCDPPREGAAAQCKTLAASQIGDVVMLSCNPATFARDAALLIAGGFQIGGIALFDQFKYSPHVEIAASFKRKR